MGLLVGVLIYLFVGPEGCPEDEAIPPFLYGTLFVLVTVLLLAVLNENIIFSISLRGSIIYKKIKRKWLSVWLEIRIVLTVIEFISLLVSIVAVFGPAPFAAGALVCPEFHDGPLIFAKVVVLSLLLTNIVYVAGFAIYLDPCGLLCSPKIWEDYETAHKNSNNSKSQVTEYAKNNRLGRLHHSHYGYGRIFWKIRGLFCCLNSNGNRSRVTAMQEMVLAFHTLFSTDDRVPTDLVAGLILLSQYQKKQREHLSKDDMKAHYLHKEFSQVHVQMLM